MDTNLDSNIIDIFPYRKLRKNKSTARLITEQNLINLVKYQSNNETFVISDSYSKDSLFEFKIGGYYVAVSQTDADNIVGKFTSSSNIYAVIKISSNDIGESTIDGEDKDTDNKTIFNAVTFTDTINSSSTQTSDPMNTNKSSTSVSLLILEKKDDQWIIPEKSKRTIDGGEIK